MNAIVKALAECATMWSDPDHPTRAEAVEETLAMDNTFTEEAIAFAVNQQMSLLTPKALEAWHRKLGGEGGAGGDARARRVIGVLNAGNIPFVEIQDLVAVLLAGFAWRGTVSSRSLALLPRFLDDLRESGPIDAEIASLSDVLDTAWALIASGSDDTLTEVRTRASAAGIPDARQWMRGHRYSIAILDGGEDEEERLDLAEDALLHEGLGCRNAALIFAPATLVPDDVLDAFATFRGTFPAHSSTSGSLKMQQAFLEALGTPHAWADGLAFLISKGDAEPQQPGHIRWVAYDSPAEVMEWVKTHQNELQTVFARKDRLDRWRERLGRDVEQLGTAQRPALDWQPDGRSHAEFFESLKG